MALEDKHRGLTIKQERFAQEYVATGNASAVYRHAYNTHAAPHTIAVEASRLLTDPDVALSTMKT